MKTQTLIASIGMSEKTYNNLLIDQGCEYVERYMPFSRMDQSILKESKTYWKWWVNQWEITNDSFVAYVRSRGYQVTPKNSDHKKRQLEQAFLFFHALHSTKVFPNRVVIEKAEEEFEFSQCQMVGEMIDNTLKNQNP